MRSRRSSRLRSAAASASVSARGCFGRKRATSELVIEAVIALLGLALASKTVVAERPAIEARPQRG